MDTEVLITSDISKPNGPCRKEGFLMFEANEPRVKCKVFVSYHHAGYQAYYDAFSKAFCDTYDVITDNSLEREVDNDDVDYVMRRIRENYISGTCAIVLVGKDTSGRKYVDWEIKATLEKEHALIGVQLPTAPVSAEKKVTVPGQLFDNKTRGLDRLEEY